MIYWYGKMRQWPELRRQAIKYLACPVASVSSEHVFSAAGTVVTVRRTNLLPENMEKLTVIKMYQHFIPQDYTVPETAQEEDGGKWSDSNVLADELLGKPPEFEDRLYFPD